VLRRRKLCRKERKGVLKGVCEGVFNSDTTPTSVGTDKSQRAIISSMLIPSGERSKEVVGLGAEGWGLRAEG